MSVRVAVKAGTFRLRRWHEATPGEKDAERLSFRGDPSGAAAFLRRLLGESSWTGPLRGLLASEPGHVARLDDDEVLRLLSERIASGEVQVWRLAQIPLRGKDLQESEDEGAEAPAPAPRSEKKTWIEIALVGMDGSPIPYERYRILLPDGDEREGTLDARGFARIDGLDPGTCMVTFPRLDQEAWQRV